MRKVSVTRKPTQVFELEEEPVLFTKFGSARICCQDFQEVFKREKTAGKQHTTTLSSAFSVLCLPGRGVSRARSATSPGTGDRAAWERGGRTDQ